MYISKIYSYYIWYNEYKYTANKQNLLKVIIYKINIINIFIILQISIKHSIRNNTIK